MWLSRNDRWASPKFIAGESYGTTRSAGLADYLQNTHGMYLNGICLISSVINWGTKVFNIGHDLPYPLILPTYTATAWYHGKLPERYDGNLQIALSEAEEFALGDYASALMLGSRLQGERRDRIRARLAELSGLSEDYLERADLRVDIYSFVKELLRDQGQTVRSARQPLQGDGPRRRRPVLRVRSVRLGGHRLVCLAAQGLPAPRSRLRERRRLPPLGRPPGTPVELPRRPA